MYFSQFPIIFHDVDESGQLVSKSVRDITINVRLQKAILENVEYFEDYIIEDGETLDKISNKLYDYPIYHWVIALCNQRFNYIEDYPMNQLAFGEYLKKKYQAVSVPTFPSVEMRDLYIRIYGLTNVYLDDVNAALPWVKDTYYKINSVVIYNDQFYKVVTAGLALTKAPIYLHRRDAAQWQPLTHYSADEFIYFENNYYWVTVGGNSGTRPPSHTTGTVKNGNDFLQLCADVIFIEKLDVLKVDPNITWPLFPTENEAEEFINLAYTVYGREIKSSTNLYHLHHYEDEDGHVLGTSLLGGGNQPAILDAKTNKPYNTTDLIEVTNYDYEVKLNESKRSIKILPKSSLMAFVEQTKQLIKQGYIS